MTSLVEHCSPRSPFSWLPERGCFFWWETPLIAASTPALYAINHAKLLEKRERLPLSLWGTPFWSKSMSALLLLTLFFVCWFFFFHSWPLPLGQGLYTVACFIRRAPYRVAACYRWQRYMGEVLSVSGETRSHAIPHTPIKTPAQGRDFILIHFSSEGLSPSNYLDMHATPQGFSAP